MTKIIYYFIEIFSKSKARYPSQVKALSCLLHLYGLSLRCCASFSGSSHESIRLWVNQIKMRVASLSAEGKGEHPFIALDETWVKGVRVYIWGAIDIKTREVIFLWASFRRREEEAEVFISEVLRRCEGEPIFLVDRGPWYRCVLAFKGLKFINLTFGLRNYIEGFFRTLKERARRFCLNFPGGMRRLREFLQLFKFWYNHLRIHLSLGQPPCPLKEVKT